MIEIPRAAKQNTRQKKRTRLGWQDTALWTTALPPESLGPIVEGRHRFSREAGSSQTGLAVEQGRGIAHTQAEAVVQGAAQALDIGMETEGVHGKVPSLLGHSMVRCLRESVDPRANNVVGHLPRSHCRD